MSVKSFPMAADAIISFADKVGTPFHIYDESRIADTAERIKGAFVWNAGFTNYFAVKALPNVNIVRLLGALGFGADCSSLPELIIAEKAGITGERIMFSSNDTPDEEFRKAYEESATGNEKRVALFHDSLQLREYLAKEAPAGRCFLIKGSRGMKLERILDVL